MNTSGLAKNVDSTVQSVLTLALATFGVKRGVERAAEMLGVSERWVRSFRFGGPARVSADTYVRAIHAQKVLAEERLAQLNAEIASLDHLARTRPDEETTEPPGVRVLVGRGEVRGVERRKADRSGQSAARAGGVACQAG